jgi:RNA polymerase sigma-70 factor (ECF subfamily)
MPTELPTRTGRVSNERRRNRRHPHGFSCPTASAEVPEPACDLRTRFQAGDDSTIRELYDRYGRQMYAVAMSALGDRQLAADCVQIAFVKAWQAAPRFDVTREFGPWLATITRRAAVDVHRRERRHHHDVYDVSGADTATPDPNDPAKAWDVWRVRGAVDQLSPLLRDVVKLVYFDQLSHAEVAERLGIPVGTVKSRSFTAHRQLAAMLGDVA